MFKIMTKADKALIIFILIASIASIFAIPKLLNSGGPEKQVVVNIDGKEIADLDTAEKAVIYPVTGSHIFSAWPKGMCGGGMSEQSGDVIEGKTLMYRVGYGTNGDFGIYPTAF